MVQQPFRGTLLNKSNDLSNGLIIANVFNEHAGKTLFNLSNNHNSTIDSADWVSDGLYFDGVNNYVYTDIINHNIGTGNFTWSVLIKPHRLTNGYEGIIGNQYYNPGLYASRSGGNWGMYWAGARDSGSTLEVDKWYLLTVVRDDTTVKFYENGIQTPTEYTITQSMSNAVFRIGAINNSSVNRGNLTISEVLIYNRNLLSSEIIQLNADPYQMFQEKINPAILYHESIGGINIPVFINHYNQMRV